MKNLPQLPYVLAAVVVWLLAGAIAFQICNNPNTGLLVAFLAAWFTWKLGTDKTKSYESALEDPPARLYNLSHSEVFALTQEALVNHPQDKRWCLNGIDGAADEDSRMKLKFLLTYEEELSTKPPITLKRQLILDFNVAKVSSQTSVNGVRLSSSIQNCTL